MERNKLTQLAYKVAKEHDITNPAFIDCVCTLAVAAKVTFDEVWNNPQQPRRSKVAAMTMSSVHEALGIARLRGRQMEFVSDVLVEAYHIHMIPHPIEESYLFLYLDQLRLARETRSVWAWRGAHHTKQIGSVQDIPEFAVHEHNQAPGEYPEATAA